MSQHVSPVVEGPPLLPERATADGTLRRFQEEALVRFAERGYHGVSVREIAHASGVKASSMYAHLASKEQLLFDLVLLAHEEHRNQLRQALLSSGAEPVEQLRAVVAAHVAMHATFPLLATVANNELHALSEESARVVLAYRGEAEQIIGDVLERGLRLGAFHVEEPWLAVAAIGAMGIRVAAWYRPGSPYSIEQVCERYADFAVKLAT